MTSPDGNGKIAINCAKAFDKNEINCADVHDDDAINCASDDDSSQALPAHVRALATNSLSDNTKRAYRADMAHYRASGRSIPSSPLMVAEYLAEGSGLFAVSTLQRRLASISKAHNALGTDDPCKSELVRSTMRGIRCTHGIAQRLAQALLRDDLFAVLDRLGNRPKDIRDRALILVGFAAAMRRSELVALDFEDIEFVDRGALVTVRRSKTDQEARGRKIAVPRGRTRHCPIVALQHWLAVADIGQGPIFCAVNKHGMILQDRISGEAVSQIIKARVAAAGFDPVSFSGHSLRAGFAAAAAQAGASSLKIRQVTGHRSEASLAGYIREVDLFDDIAAARIL